MSAKVVHHSVLLFVIINWVEKNIRLQLNAIYVAGVESTAVDVLYRLPVDSVEYLKIPQKSGVWLEGWLPLAQSVTEELGTTLVEKASLLEEEEIHKSCVAMVETLTYPKVFTWGCMVSAAKDPSYSAVERNVLDGAVFF